MLHASTRPRRTGSPRVRTCRALVALGALALTLGGCTTLGPEFERPKTAVEPEWLEAGNKNIDPAPTAPDAHAEWWKVFNDPVLDRLIQIAYQQNLDLQISGLRILEARAVLGIAVGNQFPQLQQLRGGYTRTATSETTAAVAPDTRFSTWDTGFDASWELDVWGRFKRGIQSADADLSSSIADYDDFLVSLNAEVARAYVLIRTFEERIAIAQANVKIQARSLKIADVRFRNGLVSELDVQQALSLLRNTEASIPFLEIGERQAKNGLSILLGVPPSNLTDLLGASGTIPVAPAQVAAGIPAELLRRRPDIRRAELDAASQSAQIGVAQADLYPSFSLTGAIGYESEDLGDLFKSNSLAGFISPNFQWNIFNYGRIKNNVRVQDARYQQLLVNYQNTVLRAAQEVEDGLVGFVNSREQVRLLRESVGASQRSVDLSLIQYRDGVVDYTRVLNSQQTLVDQQDALTASRGDIALNLVAMYKALGGGWQIREGNDFVHPGIIEQMAQRTDWGELTTPAALQPPPEGEEAPVMRPPDW